MRIAFISTMKGFAWGGSEVLWSKTAELALKNNHSVLISIFDWGTLHPTVQNLQMRGASVHVRPRETKAKRLRFYQRWLKILKQKILPKKPEHPYQHVKDFNPDIICVSQGYTFEVFYEQKALLDLLLTHSYPYQLISLFGFEHGMLPYNSLSKAQNLFTKATNVFFVAERNLQSAERQLALQLRNSQVISVPSSTSAYSIVEYPRISTVTFACAARLDCNFKGQDILLQILASDTWKQRNWILNIYGTGPDEGYLKDLCRLYNIEDKVKFRGFESDVRKIWEENQILLMPSHGEGTPIVLVEAMLCGRTVLATDVGGNSEVIINNYTGFLADVASVNSFGRTLEEAWQQKDKWMEMGIAAHTEAKKKIDPFPEEKLLNYLTATIR
ncbi:glycosyltransferase family 4 protein [Cytophagaceae bacterium YF14B1]|uniref:Glycosyltransferase family 4 protein n=1 Tax=Xanthocytophaga flava TaxID=3048013 RepID=A0AAE3U7Z9_9BACT|nr:glycosyltransferase family 4 protein [Xanthocytophaga flavus]MDJ1482162.1 glycosyltransferase family 4 protein [Xanthocytophaga flavus]